MSLTVSRRHLFGAALTLTLPAGLAACGRAGASDTGAQALRFGWWGNEYLNRQTDAAIAAFEKANPGVTVTGEPGEWGSYWDKLATQTAARKMPDVIQMDQKYIAEYGGRGALLDLSQQPGIDTSQLDAAGLQTGVYDGKLYGISTGQNAYVVMANTAVFTKAGVDLPDDTTWTWDDYIELAATIGAAGGGDYFGASYGSNEADLIIWLRQHGDELYTADGGLGFQDATVAGFWQRLASQRDKQASPNAGLAAEDGSASLESSLFGTNRVAMSWWWTNQLGSLADTTGSEIVMLRAPSVDGRAAANGMYYKPSMFWSAAATSAHPELAASLINFLVNDAAAGAILLTDRGVPLNAQTNEHIAGLLKPADATVVEFLKALEPDLKPAPNIPPVGAGSVQTVIQRYTQDVLFERRTPAEAASAFRAEVQGLLDSAVR
ncbi:extracellular solute-binding protein [Micrococcales bacterium 31B]|nr:extracellular solute-binding protein [Micrococcales bacterium 31B]